MLRGAPIRFAEHFGGKLAVNSDVKRLARFIPDESGCFIINVNRTGRGLAKERLHSCWVVLQKSRGQIISSPLLDRG